MRGGEPCAPAGARPSLLLLPCPVASRLVTGRTTGREGHPGRPCPELPCHPSAAIRSRVALPASTPSSSPHRGPGCLGAVWGCLRPAPCSWAAGCVWPLSLPLPGHASSPRRSRRPGSGTWVLVRTGPRQGAVWSGDPPPSSPGRLSLGFREVPPQLPSHPRLAQNVRAAWGHTDTQTDGARGRAGLGIACGFPEGSPHLCCRGLRQGRLSPRVPGTPTPSCSAGRTRRQPVQRAGPWEARGLPVHGRRRRAGAGALRGPPPGDRELAGLLHHDSL